MLEHVKVGLVGTVGLIVATTGLENVTKMAIAMATLVYTVANAIKAVMDLMDRRKKRRDEKTD